VGQRYSNKEKEQRMIQRMIVGLMLFGVMVLLSFTTMRAQTLRAEDFSADDITILYNKDAVIIDITGQTELYYCITSADKEPQSWVWMDQSDFYINDSDTSPHLEALIDLSTIKKQVDSVIYLKDTNDGTVVQKTIVKQEKLKAVYIGYFGTDTDDLAYQTAYEGYSNFTSDTGYIRFTVDGVDYLDLDSIEWKKGSGDFQSLRDLNLEYYKALGSTLSFRINTGDELISSEVKLRIQKQAKAPNIKIDGNKLTVNLKNTMEYRIMAVSGSYGSWTDPVFEEGKTSGAIAISALDGVNEDGISEGFSELTIQVRTKITEKKFASSIVTIDLLETAEPVDGEEGISVEQVDATDIKDGLLVTNHSTDEYQIAVIDTSIQGSLSASISVLDFNAKSGETGFIKMKTLKAGKSLKISYSSFSDFADSYAVVFRRAMIKEIKTTNEIEFRLASEVQGIGGDIPVADVKSGTFLIESGQTVVKTVNFTVTDGLELYVSIDGGTYNKNTANSVSYSASAGDIVEIRAYTVNPVNGDQSDTIYLRYQFVADGELSAYVDEWGYNLCKQNDVSAGSSTRTALYQRIYLAYSTYASEVNVTDLSIDKSDLSWIVGSVRIDNPDLLQAIGTYTYYMDGSGNVTKIVLNMRDETLTQSMLTASNETAADIIQGITDTYGTSATKIQKVKYVHDYLVLFKEYQASTYDQTMAAMLVNSTGYTPVCMSYALATKYVLELAGVQSVIIFGYAGESHAWNIINYGDDIDYLTMKTESGSAIDPTTWYEMDVTWDDPLGMTEDYVRYTYFNMTTDEIDNNHTRNTSVYPSYPVDNCLGTTYDYDNCIANGYFN